MRSALHPVAVVALVVATVSTRAFTQADDVTALLDRLETALATGTIDGFVADVGEELMAGDRTFLRHIAADADSVVLSERARSTRGIQVDAFLTRGDRAALADWYLTLAPAPSGRLALTSIGEASRIDDLVRLEPDTGQPLAVRDLVVAGPDFTLSLPNGTALAASVDGRYVAIALHGRSAIRFTPQDPVEQGQLRIFGNAPEFETFVDDAYIRLNGADADRVIAGHLTPTTDVGRSTIERLALTFRDRATITQRLELRHVTDGVWSLDARPGSLIVDFRTRRDGWLTYSRSPGADEDVSLFDRERRRQISLYASPGRIYSPEDSRLTSYRVEHTDLDVVLDPGRRWLRGRATLRLRVMGPTRTVGLRLADSLRVISVTSRRAGPLSSLRSAGDGGFVVGWPPSLDATDAEQIDIQFQGFLSPQLLGDDAPAASRISGAEEGLGVEPRFLYSNATAWYPQATSPQFATATLRVTVPAPFDAVATGRRGDTITSPFGEPAGPQGREGRTTTFEADRPIRYLAMLVARLDAGEQSPRPTAPASPSVLLMEGGGTGTPRPPVADRVRQILAFYDRALGTTPISELTVVTLADELPGGHSPAYFVLLNQPVPTTPYSWARDPVAFDDEPDFFLAHEIAHQWWGQTVAGRDYRDQWISEGLAQYLAWMFVVADRGEDTGHRLMRRMRESAEAFAEAGPIRLGFRLGHLRGDRRAFRAIVYNKSAVVLHQLRRLIGDEAFLAALRDLIATHRFRTVSTADVERAFAAHADMPVDRFFTQWFREGGMPRLRVAWTTTASTLTVEVEQIGQVFDYPYDLTVELADGTRERRRLVISDARHQFTFPVNGPVRRVDVDDQTTLARVSR